MSTPAERAAHALHKRVAQVFIGIVDSMDWGTPPEPPTVIVEMKHAKGLKVRGRLWTLACAGGILYPPIEKGDVVLVLVSAYDLSEMLRDKNPRKVINPYFYDRGDVVVLPGLFADSGESAARFAATAPPTGGWVLASKDGSELRLDPSTQEWVFKLGPTGKLYLGGKTGAKKVLVDGDGGVSATQDRVWAGGP